MLKSKSNLDKTMATTFSTTDEYDPQGPLMEQKQVEVVEEERQPKKKEVSFALTATVRMIPKINKSHPDASDIWYTRSDFEIFKVRDGYVMNLMMMNNNRSTDAVDDDCTTSGYCTRGLEGRIGEGHQRKISARDRARDAVFFQQDCYFIVGAGDNDDEEERIRCPPETIAIAYVACCREAQEDARVRALNDEWYVLTEIRKNEEEFNKEKQLVHRSVLSMPRNRQERRKPTVMDLSPIKQRRIIAGHAA